MDWYGYEYFLVWDALIKEVITLEWILDQLN